MNNPKRNLRHVGMGIMLLLVTCSISAPVKAQVDPKAVAKGLYTAAKWTHDNWKKIKWVWGGMDHRRWACFYKDGFITYNDFRSYRTGLDAYQYFVQGKGDCDAFYTKNKERRQICYNTPLHAKKYIELHGPVVDLKYKDDNGKFRSVYEQQK